MRPELSPHIPYVLPPCPRPAAGLEATLSTSAGIRTPDCGYAWWEAAGRGRDGRVARRSYTVPETLTSSLARTWRPVRDVKRRVFRVLRVWFLPMP